MYLSNIGRKFSVQSLEFVCVRELAGFGNLACVIGYSEDGKHQACVPVADALWLEAV